MTCIVGLVHEGRVYVGGDSAAVCGDTLGISLRVHPKVFTLSGRIVGPFRRWRRPDITPTTFVVGYTSSFRMGQLLGFGFVPPAHDAGLADMDYMITRFAEAVRVRFKDGGFGGTQQNGDHGGTFLVGYRGTLYRIEDDFQVAVPAEGFTAVGCGEMIALGAMHATEGQPPVDRITTALTAAERFSGGVRGPWTVLTDSET